jgi:hypothetical protein
MTTATRTKKSEARERCSTRVYDGWRFAACSRYAIEAGLCRQHTPQAQAARDAKSHERNVRKYEHSPLACAMREVEKLKGENAKLKAEIAAKSSVAHAAYELLHAIDTTSVLRPNNAGERTATEFVKYINPAVEELRGNIEGRKAVQS